ncbi:MAG: hypothetical protein K2K09_00475, partial [Lachnospiraceae bacterium]|nr:hypothetical protein [Lachnospiraceae bacterium]
KKCNAYANVVCVKTGKSTITATYKVGKKKAQKLTCKVTVTNNVVPTPSQAPVQSPTVTPAVSAQPTASAQPATDAPKPTKTPRPSPTPKPPTPTPMPDQHYDFEEVTNGIPIDVSTYSSMSGAGAYNKDKARVEINDLQGDNSQGSWELPDTIPAIKDGDVVTFRIQGYNYGTSGFRFWIGNPHSGGCTPVLFQNEIDEDFKIGDCGYPCVVDDEGNELKNWTVSTDADGNPVYAKDDSVDLNANKTMNQMALSPDETTKAFDVTVSFKAGASQNDTNGEYPTLTLKYIMGTDYINGLCIKNIYYIKDDAPSVTDEPTNTDEPSATTEPGQINLSTVKGMDGTPTGEYDAATGTVKIINDEANSRYLFELPEDLDIAAGDKLKVTVNGNFADENNGFRVMITTDGSSDWDRSDQGRYEPEQAVGDVNYTCTLTLNSADGAKPFKPDEKVYLAIAHKQAPIKNLTINKIVVTKETTDETPETGEES